MSVKDIAINVWNAEVPFFPSCSWELEEADFGAASLFTFNWIQAFWDNTLAQAPILVVSNGDTRDDGTYIASAIQFAYSGERINFKGKIILATGTDRRNQAVASLPINPGSPTDSFSKIIAYGGNY